MPTLPSIFYGGGQVPNPSNIVGTSGTPPVPASSAKLGYLFVSNGIMYGCVSQSGGSNVWAALGGGSAAVASLTPNSGTSPVVPVGGTISVLGSGSLTTVGSTNTLTVQLTGLTNHALLVGAGTATMTKLALGSAGQLLTSGGASADPAWTTATFPATATGTGTILRADGTNWVASTATYPNTVAAGDILIGTASNVIGSLAGVATGQVLMSGGVGVAPAYSGSPSVSGSLTAGTTVTATLGNITATNGNIVRGTAGNKDIYSSVASTTTAGANSAGTVTLAGGTATISTTAITASSIVRLYRQGIGATGAAALGFITLGTVSAGVSFVINSVQAADATALQASDVSVIAWEIVN